jgi:hypothetical protein
MTLPNMAFNPPTGFRDTTVYADPVDMPAGRDQVQTGLDQIRDFINGDFSNAIDKRILNAKTDNYTVVADDLNETITMTGTKTVTLPLISTTGFGAGFRVRVSNVGSGTVTVAATSTDTIAGAASVSLAAGKSIEVVADATGLWIVHGFDFTEIISNLAGVGRTTETVKGVSDALGTHSAALVTGASAVHGLKIEEGTWTPVIAGTTTPGTHTYSTQEGKYYKVGKLVTAFFAITMTAKGGTMAGAASITGLPFTADNLNYSQGGSITRAGVIDIPTSYMGLGLMIPASSNVVYISTFGDGIISDTLVASAIQATTTINGVLQYKTA